MCFETCNRTSSSLAFYVGKQEADMKNTNTICLENVSISLRSLAVQLLCSVIFFVCTSRHFQFLTCTENSITAYQQTENAEVSRYKTYAV